MIKSPIEWFTNYSSFAERSLERYPGEITNYLGLQMPRKVANLVRNVRVLNIVDRFNPGLIFGSKTRPGIFGYRRPQEMELDMKIRVLNVVSGMKFYPYHFEQAKFQYERVKQENIASLRLFRKRALRLGQVSEVRRIDKLLEDELQP